MAGTRPTNDSGVTRAAKNRAIRQEELREKLSAQGHIQHVVESINKLSDLKQELTSIEVQRLNASINGQMKLVDKYLADLKSVEHTGEQQTGLSELLSLAAKQAAALEQQAKQAVSSSEPTHKPISKDPSQPPKQH